MHEINPKQDLIDCPNCAEPIRANAILSWLEKQILLSQEH